MESGKKVKEKLKNKSSAKSGAEAPSGAGGAASEPAAQSGPSGAGGAASVASAPAGPPGGGRGRGQASSGDRSGKGPAWGKGGRGRGVNRPAGGSHDGGGWSSGGGSRDGGGWSSGEGGKGGKGGKGGDRGRKGSGKSGKGSGGGGDRGGGSGAGGRNKPLQELLDYLRECSKSLQSVGPEEETLLASRAIEEIGDRILLVAADQRGSKILERLVAKADAEAFTMAFGPLIEAVPELAPNQYGSHVLEAALASWSERLGQQQLAVAAAGAAEPPEGGGAAKKGEPEMGPPTAPLVELCRSLREDCGWPALVDNACASHVVRALLLTLGGYAPEPKGKGTGKARAGQLPERKFDVPEEILECRRDAACALIELITADAELCLSAHASPVVQLLLRVLRDRKERVLVAEAAAAVAGAEAVGAPPSAERCDAMLKSAAGSRALEAVLETASAEAFDALFSLYFKPRLGRLTSRHEGEFGAFLVQRLAEGLREPAQLLESLGEIDFRNLLGPEATWDMHAVVVKVLEACLRLRVGLEKSASEVFKALGLGERTEFKRAWPVLFLLDAKAEGPGALLKPAGQGRKGSGKGASGDGKAAEGAKAAGEGADSSLPLLLRQLPAAGPQLLATLLRFPVEAAEPLNSGLPGLFVSKDALRALAMETKSARVLQLALESTSALKGHLRLRLAKAFKGLIADLAPDPIGGWVAAAVYKASLGEMTLRENLAKEMLSVEESLRINNFAVWKVCGLNQAKMKTGEWAERQQKAGKAKRLFNELVDDGGKGASEAAKAAAEAKSRRAEDAASRKAEAEKAEKASAAARNEKWLDDPLMARLMGGADDAGSSGDEADDGGVRAIAAIEGKGRAAREQAKAQDRQGRRAATEIDEVFKKGRRQVGWANGGAAAKANMAAPVATKSKAVVKDAALSDVLDLIAGKTTPKSKKRRKRASGEAAVEKAGAAGDSSDSDGGGDGAPAAAGAKVAGKPAKKKRKGFAF